LVPLFASIVVAHALCCILPRIDLAQELAERASASRARDSAASTGPGSAGNH